MKFFYIILILFILIGCSKSTPQHVIGEGQLDNLVKTGGSPIIYNEDVGEYQLVFTDKSDDTLHTMPLRFDPFTGKQLVSRRHELFTTPDKREITKIKSKLRPNMSIEEVKQLFGEPNKTWEGDIPDGIKAQYDYKHIAKTFDFIILEYDSGKLRYSFSGKQIKDSVKE